MPPKSKRRSAAKSSIITAKPSVKARLIRGGLGGLGGGGVGGVGGGDRVTTTKGEGEEGHGRGYGQEETGGREQEKEVGKQEKEEEKEKPKLKREISKNAEEEGKRVKRVKEEGEGDEGEDGSETESETEGEGVGEGEGDDGEGTSGGVDANGERRIFKTKPGSKATTSASSVDSGTTTERGHIYFFYRPKVQHRTAESLDDVKNFHMLLVPGKPSYGASDEVHDDNDEMILLEPGADAVPAPPLPAHASKHDKTKTKTKTKYRLITIGKKQLPTPKSYSSHTGSRGRNTFWATVTSYGDDLNQLKDGLGEKTYETKTRGTRYNAPARLAARGAYVLVNNTPRVPSDKTTHLGFYLSHPVPSTEQQHHVNDEGDGDGADLKMKSSVQRELGLVNRAMSFVIQVKNPLAPVRGEVQVRSKGVEYSKDLMRGVFGCAEGLLEGRDEKGEGEGGEEDAECDSDSDSEEETEGEGGEGSEGEGEERKTKEGGQGGHTKGREEYGLRFASCETAELLDCTGAQIILIPSKVGMEGLEQDIGRDRARVLRHAEEVDAERVDLEGVLGELGLDASVFRLHALKGEWV